MFRLQSALVVALSLTGCLTATQWEPKLKPSTIAAIGLAEVATAAAFGATTDKDPHSDWNQESYAQRSGEVFLGFAAVDLIMFGLCHADLTGMSHAKY